MKIPKKIVALKTLFVILFGLRLTIIIYRAIKERPRPIVQSEARQSPNNDNKPGRKYADQAVAQLFKILAISLCCAFISRTNQVMLKFYHSKKPVPPVLKVNSKRNFSIIYSIKFVFSTIIQDFSVLAHFSTKTY